MPWSAAEISVDKRVRLLCTHPYRRHPNGCPNHGKRATCPPEAPFFDDWVEGPTAVIWNRFPFGEHVKRLRGRHPDWTEHQLACCLYWQGMARRALKEEIRKFLHTYPAAVVSTCPEAMGVDVTDTMRGLGIKLEWPPRKYAYQVAVATIPHRSIPDRE